MRGGTGDEGEGSGNVFQAGEIGCTVVIFRSDQGFFCEMPSAVLVDGDDGAQGVLAQEEGAAAQAIVVFGMSAADDPAEEVAFCGKACGHQEEVGEVIVPVVIT